MSYHMWLLFFSAVLRVLVMYMYCHTNGCQATCVCVGIRVCVGGCGFIHVCVEVCGGVGLFLCLCEGVWVHSCVCVCVVCVVCTIHSTLHVQYMIGCTIVGV